MKSNKMRNAFLLVLTAFIWGIAFVAQSEGGDAVGSYSFNCVRFLIGGICLLPVTKLLDHLGLSRKPQSKEQKRSLWIGGSCCGLALFVGSSFQQLGINMGTPSGKAGFITACYILLVPILGIFLKKKCTINIWFGVGLALIGLYLLCIKGDFTIQFSDLLVFGCAFVFSFHILVVEHFSPIVDGVRMSCIQLFLSSILSAIPMIGLEMQPTAGKISNWLQAFASWDAWIPILYAGIMSAAIGYTLQIIGQQGLNPTVASLLMSLESVFAVLASWVILGQRLTMKELFGCVLIFVAIVMAQIPVKRKEKAQIVN